MVRRTIGDNTYRYKQIKQSMKALRNILEGLLSGQDSVLDAGDKVMKRPEFALNEHCKDLKEMVELLAKYFEVKTPRVSKKKLDWKEQNYSQTYVMNDTYDYAKFVINDFDTGKHILELAGNGHCVVFKIKTKYIDGVVKNRAEELYFGLLNEFSYRFKDGLTFYEWTKRKGNWNRINPFSKWIEFNQNPG